MREEERDGWKREDGVRNSRLGVFVCEYEGCVGATRASALSWVMEAKLLPPRLSSLVH